MLAIIGGSGFYELDGINHLQTHQITTPFGVPSCAIIEGEIDARRILFLARHGESHSLLPHEVNYRANVFALKQLGATQIIGFSAAGSLREEIEPGSLALVDQYFDHTRGERKKTFLGEGLVGHVSMAEPVCPVLVDGLIEASKTIGLSLHNGKTYGCVEGPRLGTRAESFFLRNAAGCDLVGMTNVPEAFLAREAQMGYASVCMVTDYDCWMDDPSMHVSVETFFETYGQTVEKAKQLLSAFIQLPAQPSPDAIRTCLSKSMLTPPDHFSEEHKAVMEVLCA